MSDKETRELVLQAEVRLMHFLEMGVRGTPGVYPDWVYEARDAIRRQNENPPSFLPDLLAALGWQGGTIHAALTAVRRLVEAEKDRQRAATLTREGRCGPTSPPPGSTRQDAVKRVQAAVAEATLKTAAEQLLAAAMGYWKAFQKANPPGGAVVWVEDEDGRLVILTRGEYREQLMANVHTLGTPTRGFDA